MTEWVTWALQGLIVFILILFWRTLENNSRALQDIQLNLVENYVRKKTYDSHVNANTQEIETARERINLLSTQVELVKQFVNFGRRRPPWNEK